MQPRKYVPILSRPKQPPAAAQPGGEDEEENEVVSASTSPATVKFWTPQKDALVARLRSEGVGRGEIGRRLGRTRNAVGIRVAYLKRKDKEREREIEEGEEGEEEEEDEEKGNSTATSSPGKSLRRFTTEEDLLLAALNNEGKNNKQIGEALGRTATVISERRYALKENGKWEDLVEAASANMPNKSALDKPNAPSVPSSAVAKVPWSKADSALLRSSVLEGKDWPAVATALGRTERSCKKRWKQRRERWKSEGLLPPRNAAPASSPSASSRDPLAASLASLTPAPNLSARSLSDYASLGASGSPAAFGPLRKEETPNPFRLYSRARKGMRRFMESFDGEGEDEDEDES